MLEAPNTNKIIDVNVGMHVKNNKPVLELRKMVTDPESIKLILSLAFQDQGYTFYPCINSKIKAIASLQELGVIYLNKDSDEYEYLI